MALYQVIFLLLLSVLLKYCTAKDSGFLCDRRPLGTNALPLPPDDRFEITVEGIIDNHYIPNQKYTVKLSSSDKKSTFIAFSISASEDTKENIKNIRRPIALQAGMILPDSDDVIVSNTCNNTVIQSNTMPKTIVTALWQAPPKGNKCVTIYAVVAVKVDVWYKNEGPLIKKICEDARQKDDMQPQLNNACTVCTEARYKLTFQGHWTLNTHPTAFPKSEESARFSDLVGASHTNKFELWRFNKEASLGLKMLAEQGNTTKLEMEIQNQYKTGVRTIIKAKGQSDPNTATHSIFRVTPDYHRISIVTAIIPSPDWFLGIANLELCDLKNQWVPELTLNLYPLDAGTDSGKTFESPNDETMPPQPISRAVFHDPASEGGETTKLKYFAKITLFLVRKYDIPNCIIDNSVDVVEEEYKPDVIEPIDGDETPSYTTESNMPVACDLTDWEEWLPCTGDCVDGVIKGFRTRMRYYRINGEPVDQYNQHGQYSDTDIPRYCRGKYQMSETEECEEPCTTEDEENA